MLWVSFGRTHDNIQVKFDMAVGKPLGGEVARETYDVVTGLVGGESKSAFWRPESLHDSVVRGGFLSGIKNLRQVAEPNHC